MKRAGVVALVLLGILGAACSGPTPPPAPAAVRHDPGIEARQALDERDWARAARLFAEAITGAPGALGFHYGLAIAASHLDRREDAVREFRWVLTHGSPASAEVQVARSWLTTSGALDSSATAARRPGPPQFGSDAVGDASLRGRVTWSDGDGTPVAAHRVQIHLLGRAGTPTARARYTVRTDEAGYFQFRDVVAGPYQLTNELVGQPRWRLGVDLEPGRDRRLDLSPTNRLALRDDFPDAAR